MTERDGRHASQAYRVRVGDTWYWVDPTVPATDLEAGDIVVIHPVNGSAYLAVLQGKFEPGKEMRLARLAGEGFSVAPEEIAALHLAAVDETQ